LIHFYKREVGLRLYLLNLCSSIMSKSQNGSSNDLTKAETDKGGDDFIQVKKKIRNQSFE